MKFIRAILSFHGGWKKSPIVGGKEKKNIVFPKSQYQFSCNSSFHRSEEEKLNRFTTSKEKGV